MVDDVATLLESVTRILLDKVPFPFFFPLSSVLIPGFMSVFASFFSLARTLSLFLPAFRMPQVTPCPPDGLSVLHGDLFMLPSAPPLEQNFPRLMLPEPRASAES